MSTEDVNVIRVAPAGSAEDIADNVGIATAVTARVIPLKQMPVGGSDAALKQDVTSLADALAKVVALRPVTWHWKPDMHDSKDLQYGFIAQEVEDVIPNLVTEGTWRDGSTKKFLNVHDMVPYLVEAIREQQIQIASLQTELDKVAGS